jgi:hypothetical protein
MRKTVFIHPERKTFKAAPNLSEGEKKLINKISFTPSAQEIKIKEPLKCYF